METGKSSGKTVRRVIAVFHGEVYYRNVAGQQFFACKRKPAVSDILCDGISAQYAESFVEVKGRDIDMLRHILHCDILCYMTLNITDSLADCFCPFHSMLRFRAVRALFSRFASFEFVKPVS